MNRLPILTFGFCLLAGALHVLPDLSRQMLFFDHMQMANGNYLGLLYGHWLHADAQHLAWNVGAFAILGTILERRSRALLLAAIAAGTLLVDLLLLSPLSGIELYCGLSGMLNTLFGCALYVVWKQTRSPWVPALAALALAKIAIELTTGSSLITEISWPPYAPAHLAGMLGAILVVALFINSKHSAITLG